MIAVMLAAPTQGMPLPLSFMLVAVVAVAAFGVGPCASWIAQQRRPRRWFYATVFALMLFAGLLVGRQAYARQQFVVDCDRIGWFWSWIFTGTYDCGEGG